MIFSLTGRQKLLLSIGLMLALAAGYAFSGYRSLPPVESNGVTNGVVDLDDEDEVVLTDLDPAEGSGLESELDFVGRKFSATRHGFLVEIEYQGGGLWSYDLSGQLLNPCYNYDYRLIKTGAQANPDPADISRVDLEMVVEVPGGICDERSEVGVRERGQFEAPVDVAFIFLVDVQVDPTVEVSQGFTARARYVDHLEWSYSVQGEIENDCWLYDDRLALAVDQQLRLAELTLTLTPPPTNNSSLCDGPVPINLEGSYSGDPKTGFVFKVVTEELQESVSDEVEDDD